ncbi:MAG TPA: 3-dehydroquinate synthase II [Candidatus Thermoplasmatota archaeon]|nr:3-dehydroquinate synthase II [Candidatus Thermoplasmatota archaeon]
MSRIPLWIDLRHVPINKRLPYLHAVEEMAAERVLLAKGDPHADRPGLQVVTVDSRNQLRHAKKAVGRLVVVKDAKSQQKAAEAAGIVVVDAQDWAIIPLENLIAARRDRPGTLYALARTPEQAGLFAETLEVGVHGIVLMPASAQAIFDADGVLRARYRGPGPEPGAFAGLHGRLQALSVRDAVLAEAGVEVLAPDAALPAAAERRGPVLRRGGSSGLAAAAAAAGPTRTAAPKPTTAAAPAPASAAIAPQPAMAAARPAPATRQDGPPAPTRGQGLPLPAAAPAGAAAQEPLPFLIPATVDSVEDGGLADRVCVDTTSLFRDGEGLLVGSTSRGFVLVQAETAKNPYVEPRPFRVNAGAVHSYLFSPDGRTRYLSEVAAGQPVLAVHPDGVHRVVQVGRCKIERRPHLLVRWTSAAGPGMAVLQNAETVRLTTPQGEGLAVTDLKPGARILVHHETAARHFGMPVDEHLREV